MKINQEILRRELGSDIAFNMQEEQISSKDPNELLNKILGDINVKDDQVKNNNVVLHIFLKRITQIMKQCDELFKMLFQRHYFTGSFYSKLRIHNPNEFDINLVLKFPFNDSDVVISLEKQKQSFVKYFLKNHEEIQNNYPDLVSKLFEDGFLIPEKVRHWLQSVFDKALPLFLESDKKPKQIKEVTHREAGPARNIILKTNRGRKIYIDLVAVAFCMLDLPKGSIDKRVLFITKMSNPIQAFLVPKPQQRFKNQKTTNERTRRLWKPYFPETEKQIMKNMGCAKSVIKLLKLLRDMEDWKILSSYYLKTVVMWMIIENPKSNHWKENNLSKRFIEALEELAECVLEGNIPHIFDMNNNLIEKMNDDQSENIYNCIMNWLTILEEDPCFFLNTYKEKSVSLKS